jgi:hypothetical protein
MLGEVHVTLKYLGPIFACSRRMKKPSACIGPARTKLTDMSKAHWHHRPHVCIYIYYVYVHNVSRTIVNNCFLLYLWHICSSEDVH